MIHKLPKRKQKQAAPPKQTSRFAWPDDASVVCSSRLDEMFRFEHPTAKGREVKKDEAMNGPFSLCEGCIQQRFVMGWSLDVPYESEKAFSDQHFYVM